MQTGAGIMHKRFHEPSLITDHTTTNNPILLLMAPVVKNVTNSLNHYWPTSLSSPY